jgi:predicted Rossmann fold nucleotide-binding protein DprA/Smf involved in DNA uptake
VVGSRDFNDYPLLEKTVDMVIFEREYKDITIISGGARGADTLAELYAAKRKYPIKVYEAEWDRLGKSAGYARNTQIVMDSDLVIAFRKPGSKGTQNTIDQANNYAIETIVIDV